MALLCIPALSGLDLSIACSAVAWVGDCCVGVSRHFWHLGASPAVCTGTAVRHARVEKAKCDNNKILLGTIRPLLCRSQISRNRCVCFGGPWQSWLSWGSWMVQFNPGLLILRLVLVLPLCAFRANGYHSYSLLLVSCKIFNKQTNFCINLYSFSSSLLKNTFFLLGCCFHSSWI